MDDAITAEVVAGNGVYDADAKTLVLTNTIEVKTTDGMAIQLDEANIDIGAGKLRSNSKIVATSPQADISSASLNIEESGDRLVFEGDVRMTLRPKRSDQTDGAINAQ